MRNPKPRLQSHPSLWENLRPQARLMRRRPTSAEAHLWQARRKGAHGLKFRRQHAIARFIVDFYCVKAGLVIEIDGPVHDGQVDADNERMGLRVLRFSNREVLEGLPLVMARIEEAISVKRSIAPSPRKERGLGER